VKRARRAPILEWIECLESELEEWFTNAGWDSPLRLDTIFVGGGTPSLLGSDGMAALSRLLGRWFRVDPEALEWTAEANPASFDRETAEAWREAGVNRLSLGVQSLDDRVLRWLGRLHDGSGAVRALRTAADVGFEHISSDLMFGLPAVVSRDWPAEIEGVLASGVGHVSAYGLTVEKRTPLHRWIELGRIRSPNPGRYAMEYAKLASSLRRAGFSHYEISNFARPGEESVHNWQYWNGAAYLGIGPSAHSFLPPIRSWNVFRWDAYRGAIRDGSPVTMGWERLTGEARELERLWLSLRTRSGLPDGDPVWARPAVKIARDRWVRAGWLERRHGRIVATAEGWLRLDAIVAEIASSGENRD
jgi:oxygen-independent coproporphyrinogen-3 oxidase